MKMMSKRPLNILNLILILTPWVDLNDKRNITIFLFRLTYFRLSLLPSGHGGEINFSIGAVFADGSYLLYGFYWEVYVII